MPHLSHLAPPAVLLVNIESDISLGAIPGSSLSVLATCTSRSCGLKNTLNAITSHCLLCRLGHHRFSPILIPPPTILHSTAGSFQNIRSSLTLLTTPYRHPIKLNIQTSYGSPESLGSTPADLLVPMPDALPPVQAAPAPPAFSLLLNLLISLPGMFFSQVPPSHSLSFSLNLPPQESLLGPHPVTL